MGSVMGAHNRKPVVGDNKNKVHDRLPAEKPEDEISPTPPDMEEVAEVGEEKEDNF